MIDISERHFFFENEGESLLGVVHVPERQRCGALLLLHGWAGYRIGAHRMLVKLARAATQQGFVAMRFDFRGRGDSGGDAGATTLSTMISDTVQAASVLTDEYEVARVSLVGDCSGSEVAIGAGSLIAAADSMVLWSAPMVAADRSAARQAKRADVLRQYVRKVFRAETWRKLLGGRLRLDMIRQTMKRGGAGAGEETAPTDREVDWLGRFGEFRGERLFIYGGSDPGAPSAQQHYQRLSTEAGCAFNCHVVAGANHAFYSLAWEREVIETTLDWLAQRYQGDEQSDDL